MKLKNTMAVLAATTLVGNAAIVLDSVSVSGTILTITISGTLDNVGLGNDLNSRNLLFFADKRLGDGTTQNAALGYEDWISGAANAGHNLTGTLGGVTVGTFRTVGGLSTALTGNQVAIRRDGNDTSAGSVRGNGSGPGAIDYLVAGFGNGNGTYAALVGNTAPGGGTALDLTFSFSLGSGSIENLDTVEKFSSAFALYANDGNNNAQINAGVSNYNELLVVPEPSSSVLLGIGGLALVLRRRK